MKTAAYRSSILFLAAMTIFSCGKSDNPPEPVKPIDKEIEVTSIIPKAGKVSLSVGDEHNIEYAILPSDATNKEVEITTEHPSVVSISGKIIKAITVGSATVIVKSKSSQVTAKVEIKVQPINAKQISLDKSALQLHVGQKETITAEILPGNATDKSIIWTSIDPSIVKVNEEGKVEALKLGTTEVVASTHDGTIESKAKVDVLKDIAFIAGRLKFTESLKDGKKYVVMETLVDNKLNVDINIIAVESYIDGRLGAVDLESFSKVIAAGQYNQLVNQFTETTGSTNTKYPTTWYTKLFFTLKGLIYCLITKEQEATIVKMQSHGIGLHPDWKGENTTEF